MASAVDAVVVSAAGAVVASAAAAVAAAVAASAAVRPIARRPRAPHRLHHAPPPTLPTICTRGAAHTLFLSFSLPLSRCLSLAVSLPLRTLTHAGAQSGGIGTAIKMRRASMNMNHDQHDLTSDEDSWESV